MIDDGEILERLERIEKLQAMTLRAIGYVNAQSVALRSVLIAMRARQMGVTPEQASLAIRAEVDQQLAKMDLTTLEILRKLGVPEHPGEGDILADDQ